MMQHAQLTPSTDSGTLDVCNIPAVLKQWRNGCETTKHLMGTTCLHHPPSPAVAGRHCQILGARNAPVARRSVQPFCGYAISTITSVAPSRQRAEHLVNPLATRSTRE